MTVELRFLGPFDIRLDGKPAAIRSGRKAMGMLAVVAASPGRRVARDRLAAILWGDRFEEQARQSLRQTLSALRREFDAVAPAALDIGRDSVALSDCVTDLDLFEAALRDGDYATAASLWRGGFAADLDIEAGSWKRWCAEQNERLRPGALAAFEGVARQTAAPAERLATAERMLELDPHNEAAIRLAVPAIARMLGTAAATARFEDFTARLVRERGRQPSAETQIVCTAGLSGSSAGAPRERALRPAASPVRRYGAGLAAACFAVAVAVGATVWREGDREADVVRPSSGFIEPAPFAWPFRFLVAEPRALDRAETSVRAAGTLGDDLRLALGVMPGSALAPSAPQADFLMESDVRSGEAGRLAINLRLVERASGRVIWADTLAGSERYAGGFPEQRAAPVDTAVARAYAALLVEMDRRRPQLPPPSPEVAQSVREGWAALRGGANRQKVDESDAAFRRALALDPESAEARVGVAHSRAMYLLNFWTDNRAEEAAVASRLVAETIERSGRQPIAFFVQGLIHKSQRDYARGLAAMRVALQIQPQHAASYAQSAHMHLLNGDADRAVEMAELGVLLGPDANALDRALLYAGMARLLVGDYQAAARHLHRSFEINRTFADIYAWYAVALFRSGSVDEARTVYRAMRSRWPAHRIDHHVLVSHTPQRMERFTSAIAEIEALAGLDTERPVSAN